MIYFLPVSIYLFIFRFPVIHTPYYRCNICFCVWCRVFQPKRDRCLIGTARIAKLSFYWASPCLF